MTIEVNMFLRDVDRVMVNFFSHDQDIKKQDRIGLIGMSFNRILRRKSYNERGVDICNVLPLEVMESDTVTKLKRHLGRYFNRKDLVLMWAKGIRRDGQKVQDGRHGKRSCFCSAQL